MAKDLFASLDLNLLRTFVVLSQELNMRKAAERLFVSQPAISQAAQKLRNHFDDELFVRTRHGLRLTAYAEELIDSLGPIIDDLESALNATQDFDLSELEGTVKVAMAPHVLAYLSSRLFMAIREVAPNVDVHLLNWSPSTLDDLMKGEISLGVNFEIAHAPKELASHKLIDEQFVLFMRKGHPLEPRVLETNSVLTLEDVKDYEFATLIVTDWNSNVSYAERIMNAHGLNIRVGFRTELPMAVLEVVKNTDMIYPSVSYLPESQRSSLISTGFSIADTPAKYSLCSYYHQKNRRKKTITWVNSVIKQLLSESGSQ
ncbi:MULTISPECIES: LysR family transcriptional regulator [unclassified Agarivorans]|uniref:LysR family transcriptional regulator n=1 Tax=unclassified Agarivorans TaxID=2636026 RepID=UPI0026E34A0B|nr:MULTISPECIES: LysR family transcriptional regulator [unclassified Agarivorans]MDO6687546.1 LysR family transcriptional regulator [Agarivorans sp. 3_MG-2023]MDO6717121.1 LysR family transcriptional regulator [Agarivorans sp. 2_MG-2023]